MYNCNLIYSMMRKLYYSVFTISKIEDPTITPYPYYNKLERIHARLPFGKLFSTD